jgi:hypothetical protein
MEHEPGYTPLAHQEECDCCCGCDSFAERDDYLESQKAADPSNPPLPYNDYHSSVRASRVHVFRILHIICLSQGKSLPWLKRWNLP